MVTDEEAKAKLEHIKPQPLPEIRNRITLDEWKWMGFKPGIREREMANTAVWAS